MQQHLAHYFETHPEAPEVFETADACLFHTEPEAAAHAETLESRQVLHHQRPKAAPASTGRGKKSTSKA